MNGNLTLFYAAFFASCTMISCLRIDVKGLKMQKTAMVLLGLSLLSGLAACGTKGQLYIPEERYPQTTTQQLENSQKPPEATQKRLKPA
jgi:predicted small lipoprotein YifL